MESFWFLFRWCPLLSVDCFHKLCLPGTPSENSQGVEILEIGWLGVIDFMRNVSVPWEVMPEVFKCSVRETRWLLILEQNRTLEYLRHNFPWDRLMSRQTDNPWPFYSQDLKPPDYFLGGGRVSERQYLWKQSTGKRGHHQKRNQMDSNKTCSTVLWTILMFELFLCCDIAGRCMERT